mgnify:FL=1
MSLHDDEMAKPKCGAKTRAGTPCRKPAGWGTDHPGDGRCKLHAGCSPRGADHPNFKHGERSKYFDPSMVVGFEEFKAALGPNLDFEDRVLFRVFLADQLTVDPATGRPRPLTVPTKDGPVEVNPDPYYLLRCADTAGKVYERLRQAREGVTVNVRLDDEQLQKLMEALGDALAECVSDPAEAEAVLDFIAARMRE